MNYFAHGIRFVDRPYFLAGTAAPDWLAVIDRRVRLRTRHVQPFADGVTGPAAELAAGVLQHFDDDGWFPQNTGFARGLCRVDGLVPQGASCRRRPPTGVPGAYPDRDAARCSTHQLVQPDSLAPLPDAFFAALTCVGIVESGVNQMARQPDRPAAGFIPLFTQEKFLSDYQDSRGGYCSD